MRFLRYTIFLIILFSLAGSIIVSSCSSDECYDNKNALPYAGFYGMVNGKETELRIDSVEIYGVGAPGDSVLSTGRSAISKLYLPFRIDSDTTKYVFRYIQKDLEIFDLRDTVTFIYGRDARFVSAACGVSYVFEIKEILNTGFMIDSVICPGMRITNANTENLKIYFPVAQPEDSSSSTN